MIWMPMYIHVIFSYLAAVGFAVFLNSPKKNTLCSRWYRNGIMDYICTFNENQH